MSARIDCSGLSVATELHDLINQEIAPEAGVDPAVFWQGLADIVFEMSPKNREMLEKRRKMHEIIGQWHHERPGSIDFPQYKKLLKDIGYLLPEGDAFTITTENVDPEIACVAGPQLVVPVNNARFALNAANARWGSLYDAYYGTDVISEEDGCEKGSRFNPARGEKVIALAAALLDEVFPLAHGSHSEVEHYRVQKNAAEAELVIELGNGKSTSLARRQQFTGYAKVKGEQRILLKNNGLHVELQIDRESPIGRMSASGLKDVLVESAITTIQD